MKLLEVERVTKRFGGLEALREVSLEVREGEILGLIGPNGAGKTTLFNVISGHLKPTRGSVSFLGQEIQGRPAHEIARKGIARTFQIPKPFYDMTVDENVAAGLGLDFYSTANALLASYRSEAVRQRVGELLHDVALTRYQGARPDTLPIGMHRRLEIARALALTPRLLLLDEPTAGLVHAETEQLSALTRTLAEEGLTILLIEHNMTFAMNVCQRIVVLSFGEVIAEGSPESVREDPRVIESYLGQIADA
jgi:branched-chain amino acid transport system ATP-binding protein